MVMDLRQHAPDATGRPVRLAATGSPTQRIAPARPARSGASGPGASHMRDSWQASMLGARIVIAAIVVLGQLWALTVATVALDGGHEGKSAHVWLFVVFEALSFAVAFWLWTSTRHERE